MIPFQQPQVYYNINSNKYDTETILVLTSTGYPAKHKQSVGHQL